MIFADNTYIKMNIALEIYAYICMHCIDIFAFNVKCILQYPMFMDITQVYFQLQLLLIQCLCELMFLLLFCMLTVMPLESLD